MKRKWLSSVLATIVLTVSLCSPALAAFYGNEFPDYVPVSGGAYCEVQSTIGKGTLVFPIDKADGSFCYSGSGSNFTNCTTASISGYFYPSNRGQPYQVRYNSFSNAQYRVAATGYYDWNDFEVSQILNTNIVFLDNTSTDRPNSPLNFNAKEQIFLAFLALTMFVPSVITGFLVRRGA